MKTIPPHQTQALVLTELHATAQQLQAAKDARLRAIKIGRTLGITWTAIGEQLGITDAAVIGLIQRADQGK